MSDAKPHHARRGVTLAAGLLATVVVSVLVVSLLSAVYVLVPEPTEPWTLPMFIGYSLMCFTSFTAITVGAAIRLNRASRPVIEGSAFVVAMATVLILSYAWLYLSMSVVDAGTFTEQLTKSSAVYFTVTVLSTVGFGDITPVGDTSRMVVTSQMIIGFTIITVAIKTIVGTTSSAVKNRHPQGVAPHTPEEH